MTEPPLEPNTPAAANWKDWSLRPLVLFVATYTLIAVLHELAHALTAYALNVPSVLTHLYVHIDRADGTVNQWAIIGVSGPLFCLVIGGICWFAYWRGVGMRARLVLLYLGWFGVATFLGNLISTPFVGDFSALARAFEWPMSVRYGLSVTGAVLLCGLAFFVGRELRALAPPNVGTMNALLGVIVVPVIFGTLIAFLLFLPMPSEFAVGRLAESSFWIFAALGASFSRKPLQNASTAPLGWADFALLLFTVIVVRLLASGITLVP